MPNCSELEAEDIPYVLDISLKELGSDYLSRADFEEALDSENIFCMVVREGRIPAGFAICRIFESDKVDEMLRLPDGPERDALLKKKKLGLFDSVAVSDKHRGKGVGTILAKAAMDRFRSEKVETVTAMAWEDYTGHTNIGHILVNTMGMTPSIAIKGYWNLFVSSPGGHDCPMCGAPCKCFGRLHTADL